MRIKSLVLVYSKQQIEIEIINIMSDTWTCADGKIKKSTMKYERYKCDGSIVLTDSPLGAPPPSPCYARAAAQQI